MTVPKVPPRVGAVAERYRLGAFVDAVKGPNPVTECIIAIVFALVAFGAAGAVVWLLTFVPVKPLALLVVALAVAGVAIVGYGFYRLFRGFSATYRFADGIVWTRNRRVYAAPWTAVDEMRVTPENTKVPHAGLIMFDGRRVPIAGDDVGKVTVFIDAIAQVVRDHRRPVLHEHRYDGQESLGLPLEDKPLALVTLFVGSGLVAAVAFVLWGVGLPGPVAAIVAIVLIGLLQLTLGVRVDRRMNTHGAIFLGVAAVVTMTAAARALPDLNPYAVATAVLIVEMAILALVESLYRRLPAPRPTANRRKLATKLGLRYVARQDVGIDGPVTARELIGVPAGSTTTTLVDVVTGSIDGVPIVIGDRVRRRPLIDDPVQTVWLVALPYPLPFISESSFSAGGHEVLGMAPNSELAALMLGRLPTSFGPRWWIEGRFLYAVSDPRHVQPASATTMAGFAANLPWGELRRFAVSSPA